MNSGVVLRQAIVYLDTGGSATPAQLLSNELANCRGKLLMSPTPTQLPVFCFIVTRVELSSWTGGVATREHENENWEWSQKEFAVQRGPGRRGQTGRTGTG
jgi:hypothetical protein